MKQIISLVVVLALWSTVASAQQCAEEVLKVLYEELETIDRAGEAKLTQLLEDLAKQEGWSESERSDFTLSLSDNSEVNAAESMRTDMLGRIFGLAQRGDTDCSEIRNLHDAVLELEQEQWDAAVKKVEQRIWR